MVFLFRNCIVLFFLLCFYVASYNSLLEHRASRPEISQRATGRLPPLLLKALAGEFKGLVADLIVLDVGAQLGTELVRVPQGGFKTITKQYDWDYIVYSFLVSQTLDPSFQQTYMVAQGWLPWKSSGMLAETQSILKTAARNRPWDWQANHFLGFNYYYFLNKPGEAGKIFLEAAKTPYAPPFLAIIGARLAQKGGQTEAAIVMMKSMLNNKTSDEPGYADMRDRLLALEGVLILEESVKKYERSFGKKPDTLEDLTSSKVIENLPVNPYKLSYCMDTNGTIYFDRPNCRISASAP